MGFLDDLFKKRIGAEQIKADFPFDPIDMRACLSRQEDVCAQYFQINPETLRKHEEIKQELLGSNHRPSDRDVIFSVVAVSKNQILTISPEPHNRFALLFTSPGRAAHYLTVLGKQGWGVISYRLDQSGELAESFDAASLRSFSLDRCPFCPVVQGFEVAALRDPATALQIWATVRATKDLQFSIFMQVARIKLESDNFLEARAIGEHIVTHVDAERPEVHLLLGQCGVGLRDRELVGRKVSILRRFGSNWTRPSTELQEQMDRAN